MAYSKSGIVITQSGTNVGLSGLEAMAGVTKYGGVYIVDGATIRINGNQSFNGADERLVFINTPDNSTALTHMSIYVSNTGVFTVTCDRGVQEAGFVRTNLAAPCIDFGTRSISLIGGSTTAYNNGRKFLSCHPDGEISLTGTFVGVNSSVSGVMTALAGTTLLEDCLIFINTNAGGNHQFSFQGDATIRRSSLIGGTMVDRVTNFTFEGYTAGESQAGFLLGGGVVQGGSATVVDYTAYNIRNYDFDINMRGTTNFGTLILVNAEKTAPEYGYNFRENAGFNFCVFKKDIELNFKDTSGANINPAVYCSDVDNGLRYGVINVPNGTNINTANGFIYQGVATGGSIAFSPYSAFVHEASGIKIDNRGVANSANLIFSSYEYGYEPINQTVELSGNGVKSTISTKLIDFAITEQNKSTVDVYPFTITRPSGDWRIDGNASATQVYDKIASFIRANWQGQDIRPTRTLNQLDFGTLDVTIDATQFTGGIKTIGDVFLDQSMTLIGGTFDRVIIKSGFGGDLTLDNCGVTTVRNESGSPVNVILLNGSTVGGTQTPSGSLTVLSTSNIEITGLTSSNVQLIDSSNNTIDRQTDITGTYTYDTTLSGPHRLVVNRLGYTTITIPVDLQGQFYTFSGQLIQDVTPSGAAMYQATTNGLLSFTVNSDGSAMRANVSNGTVSAQNIYDGAQETSMTEDGMTYLANGGGVCIVISFPTGIFLIENTNFRIRRASPSDSSATVEAFVTSTQGVVLDNSNGDVQFVSVTRAQQLTEYSGSISVDLINGVDQNQYPAGTSSLPVNSITNAKILAEFYGINNIKISGDQTLLPSNISGITFTSDTTPDVESRLLPAIGITTSASLNNCVINSFFITGAFDVSQDFIGNEYKECLLSNIQGISGFARKCKIAGNIQVENSLDVIDSYGSCNLIPSGSNSNLTVVGYSGLMTISGMTSPDATVIIGVNAGVITIDSSCVSGTVMVVGATDIIDNSNGTSVIIVTSSTDVDLTGLALTTDVVNARDQITTAITNKEVTPVTDISSLATITQVDTIDAKLDSLNVSVDLSPVQSVVDSILVDTNELQQNQGNWVTATGFSTFDPDSQGVTVTQNNDKSDYQLSNNAITSNVVANNTFNNSNFTTGYYNRINTEVDAALAGYDVPTKSELDTTEANIIAALPDVSGLSTFDPVNDIVTRVTLVDTTTTNTDMRGTDGAVTGVMSYDDTALVAKVDVIDASVDAIKIKTDTLVNTDLTGIATATNVTASQNEIIAQVDANETKIDTLTTNVGNLNNLSSVDITAAVPTTSEIEAAILNEGDGQQIIDAIVQGIDNVNLDQVAIVSAIRSDLERAGGVLSGLPNLSEIEASNVLAKVSDISSSSGITANDVVVAMQSVADDFKADVSNINASYDDSALVGKVDNIGGTVGDIKVKVDTLDNVDISNLPTLSDLSQQTASIKGVSNRDLTQVFNNTPDVNLNPVLAAINSLNDFDPVNDTVSRVTLVDTTNTNSDMVDLSSIPSIDLTPISDAISNLNDFDPVNDTVVSRQVLDKGGYVLDSSVVIDANIVTVDEVSVDINDFNTDISELPTKSDITIRFDSLDSGLSTKSSQDSINILQGVIESIGEDVNEAKVNVRDLWDMKGFNETLQPVYTDQSITVGDKVVTIDNTQVGRTVLRREVT